jgi:[glutamine synthetase] adenylyltransferase / [glutamine synthetase]-adenylyl-L-tyrosine phosphorylase
MTALSDARARAEAHSPYLRELMRRFPDVSGADIVVQIDPSLSVPKALRAAKGHLALSVALGDLAGILSLEQVTEHLSSFADQSLDLALAEAFRRVVPEAPCQGIAIIALGKQGSHELNYSSDLDPILIFDPDTLPCRARDEPIETAVRIAKALVDIMQTRDADGYVFRIDLRLRPNPEITPIILPIGAAISYYESSALPWERAAFIRARACSGDIALGQRFLEAVRPFVWRRGLDFGAIAEIRGISQRIRSHYAKVQAFGPGYDLKRGRGGIRECEFFAQIHQLIHGGRDPALRVSATVPALAALTNAGWIDREEAETLRNAYRLYRTIEHRLQIVDDRQTHSLPVDQAAMDGVAKLHGLPNGAKLLELLAPHVDAIGRIYDSLDGDDRQEFPRDPTSLVARINLPDAPEIARRIATWRAGTYRATRSQAAQVALEAVLPAIVTALSSAPNPITATNRFDQLIERLPSAINLFRLLDARADLRRLLMDILCYAPTLADSLSRRADLLDGLIDASALDPVGNVAEIADQLRFDGPIELLLDHVRQSVGEMRFALGTQIIQAACDPIDVSAGYARVAEAAVEVITHATIRVFEATHGKVPDSEFVILALGRLGGGELTHASDLDLIYLFTGDYRAESNGPKPLGAVHYYNRLAQRVTSGLSVATAAGPLYEIDTRLRPSGAKGPLAVSLEGFAHYQREEAWTWEHMALARARAVYGSPSARAVTEAIIKDVLSRPREEHKLVKDAVKMRRDMAEHKPPKGPLDVKLCDGGLVDLEFCIHVAQLRTGTGLNPQLSAAISVLPLPKGFAQAHQFLTRLLVTLRLIAPDLETPSDPICRLIARACGADDWDAVLAQLATVRHLVSSEWQRIVSEAKGN